MNVDLILFHVIIFSFLYVCFLESQLEPNIGKQKLLSKRLPSSLLLSGIIILGFIGTLTFILLGPKTLLLWYMKGAFSLMLIGHALWLGLNQRLKTKILYMLVAVLLISLRLFYPTLLTHNLFIYFALFWFGPFFTWIKILTAKRFIIISLIWFIYDIVYVWLTPLANNIISGTEALGFPLAVSIGDHFIGTADLLWANCFISIISSTKYKWIGVIFLMISNIGLSFFAQYIPNLTIFPLLVLWVPIGLILLKLENISVIKVDRK